ncbi:MAG: glycosyltransferase family 2 protein [Gammaproteobacteria bacterium]|nr:glycosyltransferase family 2 protein [Gammaproteobacteria bacterium]
MKLIIQIPCYNEAQTLTETLDALPKHVPGIDDIEILVINDGSKDNTVEVARNWGVNHVVEHLHNQGLAKTFVLGIRTAIDLGADIIVNTDADNQYCADDIEKLVQPILENRAKIVIGSRPIDNIEHFSFLKKKLQRVGSSIVRLVSGTSIPDAPSGFRAYSREAAMALNVFSNYTYTLETIIQAGQKNVPMISVPVRVNEDLRPSRLVKSIPSYIVKSILTMVRMFVVYKPFRFFVVLGSIIFGLGFLLGLRFLYFYFTGSGSAGHVQSLILASILLMIGFHTVMLAFVADLLAVNRKLSEDIQFQLRKLTSSGKSL